MFGISVLLQVIGIGSESTSLYYTGAGIGMASALGFGLLWYLNNKDYGISKFLIGFSIALAFLSLWIVLIPCIPSAVSLSFIWLTLAAAGILLWGSKSVENTRALYGLWGCFLFLGIGYTFLAAGLGSGGSITFLVIGAIVGIFSFSVELYYKGRHSLPY